jgi:hypothetical protein
MMCVVSVFSTKEKYTEIGGFTIKVDNHKGERRKQKMRVLLLWWTITKGGDVIRKLTFFC